MQYQFTLPELMEKMAPQYEKDKILIRECMVGLTLYAAQHAANDPSSPKIAEMRSLVEQLAVYWGLDEGGDEKLQNDFLRPFDNVIGFVPAGASLEDEIGKHRAATVRGLHCYGMEMVFCQGIDCRDDILAMRDLMNEIARAWDFESQPLDDMARKLEAEVKRLDMDAQVNKQLAEYAASEDFKWDCAALKNDYECRKLTPPDDAAVRAEVLKSAKETIRFRLECEANGHQFVDHTDGENGRGTVVCEQCGDSWNYQW